KSSTVEQIVQQARIVDQMRGDIRLSQLEFLEKSTALFLINLFTNVHSNLGKSKAISSEVRSKSKLYELPTLETKAEVKILPMAWSMAFPPREDRYCDLESCINSSELESQCQYCADYLVSGIEENCKAFQKALDSFDRIVTDECVNESDIVETSDDTNISIEDFSLDNNIDLLIERAISTLANV
ncbi:6023_t:CDS:2, partial [Paraglomus brasilianum]